MSFGDLLCLEALTAGSVLSAFHDISVLSVPSMGCVQSKEEIDFELSQMEEDEIDVEPSQDEEMDERDDRCECSVAILAQVLAQDASCPLPLVQTGL